MVSFTEEKGSGDEGEEEGGKKKKKKKKGEKEEPKKKTKKAPVSSLIYPLRSSVVECLTWDRRAVGLSLTGITALWSLSKTHLF